MNLEGNNSNTLNKDFLLEEKSRTTFKMFDYIRMGGGLEEHKEINIDELDLELRKDPPKDYKIYYDILNNQEYFKSKENK